MTTCLQKARRDRGSSSSSSIRYNTHAPWRTSSTIQTKWNYQHLFIQIPILDYVLVHSVGKTHVLVVPTPNISLRFTRFRRIHVNWPAVVLKSHCHTAKEAFLLDVCCLKWPRSFFCSCFLLMIVHLRNLFLLSTPVARILLTSRWVSRQKNVKWSSTNISRLTVGVKHSISGRTTFSPNLHLVEQETLECNNTIARFHVITRI